MKLWRTTKRFLHLMVREYHRHDLLSMASSLSYATLFALVPIFAIILGVLGLVRDGLYTEIFISTLKDLIPAVAGMNELLDAVREIAGNARAIVGVGLLMFVGTGFFMFITVVRDFNRIWGVERARSLMARFSGFVTALILVPILIILSLYVNLYVGRTVDTLGNVVYGTVESETAGNDGPAGISAVPGGVSGAAEEDGNKSPDATAAGEGETEYSLAEPLIQSRDRLVYDSENPDVVSKEVEQYRSGGMAVKLALRLSSLLLAILGMSAVYYFFPNLKVQWKAALAGGLMAGIALEIGTYLFRIYAGMTSTVLLKIYGTLLAIPLAIGWMWILWVIVLLGAVVGYVVQHFSELSDQVDMERNEIKGDLFIALLVTIETAGRYNQGRSTEGLAEDMAVRSGVPAFKVKAVLAELLEKGVLVSVDGREGEFVPGRGMETLTVDQIVFPMVGELFSVPQALGDERNQAILEILEEAGFALRSSLEKTTLAELASGEMEAPARESE